MLERVLQLLAISCRHKNLSVPFAADTQNSVGGADWEPIRRSHQVTHYVVCLDCGTKFSYDWNKMRVDKNHPLRPRAS
jgi:hypothetical protein